MSDIKYIKLRTKNAAMMRMYGDKLTWSEVAREMRTNGLHTEIQHSDRYGEISQSCTMSDGCNGHRFKMIGYSHEYRWSTVYIPVTAEQEARLFAKGCEMADINKNTEERMMLDVVNGDAERIGLCFYGLNHIKYDKGAAFFSFISKRNIWKPSKTKMICNRACGEVLVSEWPDIFTLEDVKFDWGKITIPPHEQTPDQTFYLVDYYFNIRSNDEPGQSNRTR